MAKFRCLLAGEVWCAYMCMYIVYIYTTLPHICTHFSGQQTSELLCGVRALPQTTGYEPLELDVYVSSRGFGRGNGKVVGGQEAMRYRRVVAKFQRRFALRPAQTMLRAWHEVWSYQDQIDFFRSLICPGHHRNLVTYATDQGS